ncbi:MULTISPECIES: hypothetical protein [Paenibacillus]|uniref:hypothetical protein n=1 Tax=Paenibacillus TaxID=44249 RepID=UPI00096F0FFC|nr:hypothetical protein [Paenibacillus odorifer]OMD77972.1 hypothetical protein BSK53_24265 [Paenibacillus odorifer]
MDWLNDYEDELRLVFQESRRIISEFPEPLNQQGMSYLEHFNVFNAESHKNYICYLLPFWLQKGCGISTEVTRQMSMGNVFFMLYFFIQDDLMDSQESSAYEKLPLANLLYVEFLNIYRILFPEPSAFWILFNRYIMEWADSVSNENTSDYFLNDRVKIAYKASPLKLSSTAALLMSGKSDLVPQAEELIHSVLLTLQMLDDYEDWKEDLSAGNYNCLLSLTRKHLPNSSAAKLTTQEVEFYLFTANGLHTYTQLAHDTHNKVTASDLDTPHLIAFHSMLVSNLQQISDSIEADKQLLLNGGLYHWLSKNVH